MSKISSSNLSFIGAFLLAAILPWHGSIDAQDYDYALSLYHQGLYQDCDHYVGASIENEFDEERWYVLRIRSQMISGKYPEALQTLQAGLDQSPQSIRLRWIGRDVYRFNNMTKQSLEVVVEIKKLFENAPWRYREYDDLIALGDYYLSQGVDAKDILTKYYKRAQGDDLDRTGSYMAIGTMALTKGDFAMAADNFRRAIELDADDPDPHFGLASAFEPTDFERATGLIDQALALNPGHIPSLLKNVDRQINAESYEDARESIQQILEINPDQPNAWAYLAVIAHLESQHETEGTCRTAALAYWRGNPNVDHLIGRKLSEKYRFKEGSTYQRRSLRYDEDYLPAKMQLANDLLRLGDEKQGWKLADEVFERDSYNVVAHNLVTLRDNMTRFHTLERGNFIVRMDEHEARIYGKQVLDLLDDANAALTKKYETPLTEPVIVEIFSRQQDFAIRTFGLPGGAGFLGVCFGNVVTMNSPASSGSHSTNWQSVLWHEFCHVITLNKTQNKMPRWLSEGISVYEERLANPAWGERMNLQYRKMILGDELTPVSELSAAFMDPKSPAHLQFAYYESSLVVEYIVEKYGIDVLNRVLVDLGVGMPINDSLKRYTGSIQLLDKEFADDARNKAKQFGPNVDWEKRDTSNLTSEDAWRSWLSEHPNNFFGLQDFAQFLIAGRQYNSAKVPLETMIELCPQFIAAGNPYELLSQVCHELGEMETQQKALEQLGSQSDDALEVYRQLIEMAIEQENWNLVIENSNRYMAVNPLVRLPYRSMAMAAGKISNDNLLADSLQTLCALDPLDPADAHFRLAQVLHRTGKPRLAKRHVLIALEEAPRFREAHRLLLEINQSEVNQEESSAPRETVPSSGSQNETDSAGGTR